MRAATLRSDSAIRASIRLERRFLRRVDLLAVRKDERDDDADDKLMDEADQLALAHREIARSTMVASAPRRPPAMSEPDDEELYDREDAADSGL